MASLDFPSSPTNGQTYSSAGITWTYDSTYTVWNVTSSGPVGYSGSQGYTGSKGDIGYSGSLGYTGSAGTNGTNGYNGSQGYTGSASTVIGYTGSKGDIGYTGSAGTNGTNGYTGSAGTTGYTGSLGYSGSAATINWMYKTANYTAVNNDGILADTTSASFTVTLPASPATGTYVSIVDVTSTFATNPLTVAGNGETLQGLTYTSVVLNVTSAKVDLIYEGAYWAVATTSGTRGYTGSSGVGYTGSASTVVGYTGSLGYVGSQGYVGSAGYTGSVGYVGSSGYTGSLGYTGSVGYTGSLGYSGSGATGVNWTNKSTTYTAVNNDGIIADTSGGSFTVTLPASPSTGSYVVFLDGNSSFATYPLTVDGNGNNIADSYSTATLNITNSKVEFIYNGSTWEIATSTGTRGYSGSVGYTGSLGYTGSQGYTGSASTVIGYTGSKGDIGYTGSIPAALTATSLALGGATLGTNNLAVTGTSAFSSTVTHSGATTLSGALTYGGVTLSNSVTGTGSMVLSASPTFSGTAIFAAARATSNFQVRGDTAYAEFVNTAVGSVMLQGTVKAWVGSGSVTDAAIGAYNNLNFYTGGNTSARVIMDSTGNLGIGSSPLSVLANRTDLTINGASAGAILSLGNAGTRVGYLLTDGTNVSLASETATGYMRFLTNSAERMQITSAGLVGIGCTPTNTLDVSRATVGTYFTGNGGDNSARALAFTSSTTTNSGDTHTINAQSGTGILAFAIASTEAARITTSGYFCVGQTTSGTGVGHVLYVSGAAGTQQCQIGDGSTALFYTANSPGYSGSGSVMKVGYNSTTSRSINAGGSINASGADYAEYMTKADTCGTVSKGEIVGVNIDGKLTDKFSNSHSFVIKSTDPSYVGGDTWGVALDGSELEAARQKVDRIAFSGQVPVNVTGAAVGDYIVPVAGPDGGITGEAVTDPTFDQYRAAVGRVWKILEDGRAFVSVKVS